MENENQLATPTPDAEKQMPETKQENTCKDKKCKCCLSNILSIISLAGVIVLFVLYFTGKTEKQITLKKSKNAQLSIAFVNSDSVMTNYELVKLGKDSLEKKQKDAETTFGKQQELYQSAVQDYQTKLKANLLSVEQAQNTEKQLMAQQEKLADLKDELTSSLSDAELELHSVLQDSIINYLKRYNKASVYDYILGYAKGGGILFASDSLDLTKEVLEGLNKEYKAKKK